MKFYILIVIVMIGQACYSQQNYYKLYNDSIYNQHDFESRLRTSINTLPSGYTLVPTIYHRQFIKDSIVNYVAFMARKKAPNSQTEKIEMVFTQDSLYLLLDKKLPGFKLKDLNGKEFNSSQLTGKPALINFWSVNCGPCIEEFPQLDKLKEKYGDKVNFIAITENSKEEALALLERKPFSFYQLFDGEYYKKHTFKISSIPINIFIDKNGYVREIKGGLPYENDEKTGQPVIKSNQPFQKIIDRLLKQ
jgi:cytochrome c biogenesis protein CcmG, thiol:disulfide interchange protein DsbE